MNRKKRVKTEADDRAAMKEGLGFRAQHAPMDGAEAIGPYHGPVNGQVLDSNGVLSAPLAKAYDVLAALHAKGTISDEQLDAGQTFQKDFRSAHLNGVRAARLEPSTGGGGNPLELGEDAKRKVHEAMQVVGGHGSTQGELLWWVVGEGYSIREWITKRGTANGQRSIHPLTASGMLQGLLTTLCRHYSKAGRRRNKIVGGALIAS